jgi:hypothetical protein
MSKPVARRPQSRRPALTRVRDALVVVADLSGAMGAVSMVGAALAGLGGIALGAAKQQPALVTVGLGLTFGMGVSAAVVPLILLRASALASGRGYRWQRATYHYRIDPQDHHRHVQTVEIEIAALRNGVDAFFNQYMWSGAGDDSGPQVFSVGHELRGPVRRQRGWRAYVVELQPPLRKGETTTVAIRQDLRDRNEVFLPFLAKTMNEDCDQLTLHVELPRALTPRRAWGTTRSGAQAGAEELSRQPLAISTDGAFVGIEWTLAKPRRHINYAIEWVYDGNSGLYSRIDDSASSINADQP